MKSLLWRWLVTTLVVFMIPSLVSGVHVQSFGTALAMAAALGVLNLLVKPILIVLTLPLTMLTLGFFWLVINALIFEWAGAFVRGMQVDSFRDAFFAALIVSVVSWVLNFSVDRRRGKVVWVRSGSFSNPKRPEKTIELHEKDGGRWE